MQHFSSKILLFGEYSVVVGGNALAAPFAAYGGSFRFWEGGKDLAGVALWSNRALQQFGRAIEEMMANQKLSLKLDVELFMGELGKGLFFDSNIPKGYGLGSSGAVVAGVLNRYGSKVEDNSLKKLQQELAVLESYFHGQSSGFDPLVCYLNRAILKRKGEVEMIEMNLKQKSKGENILFLLDTQLSRETGPLVQLFLKKLKEADFDLFCKTELKPTNDACIQAFLEGNGALLAEYIRGLSLLQWEEFQPMIPEYFRGYWEKGLKSGAYALKLCGAGGGGCMMGMTAAKDWRLVESIFGAENLKVICRL